MAEWALVLAIIALVIVIALIIVLLFLFKDIYKRSINSLSRRINDLPKAIGEQVINDKDFQIVLEKAIAEKTKSIIAGSIKQIVNFIVFRTIALIKEHLNKFNSAKLIREIKDKMEDVFSQNQQSQEDAVSQD